MANSSQKGATGPLPLHANGTYQSATALATTPGAYGTSATVDVAQLVGTRWDLNDGRELILVSTGSTTTTTPGQLYQDAAAVANHSNLVTTAFTAYSNNGDQPAQVTVTLGGTAVTANQYQGGYACVVDGGTAAGQGQFLRIASHPAQTATGGNVVLTLEEAPNVALTTSSKVSLVYPHGSNIIQSPTTPTAGSVGIALYPIAPSTFGFLTAKGLCSALSDASVAAVGANIGPSITTAGTVTLQSASTIANIGFATYTAVSTKSYQVYLEL